MSHSEGDVSFTLIYGFYFCCGFVAVVELSDNYMSSFPLLMGLGMIGGLSLLLG